MFVFILAPLVIALAKGYRIKLVFKVIDLYPFLIVCVCHAFFVVNAWLGNHSFVRFAELLQYLMIITLLLPILRRKIFTPTYIGVAMTMAGTFLNRIVINANGGKMPVYPTVSKWIGYYKDGQLDGTIDGLHVLLDQSAELPFLADYIDLGTCILSPGDVLIHAFASIIIFYTIKAVCDGSCKKLN
jgi:hypothetical protein